MQPSSTHQRPDVWDNHGGFKVADLHLPLLFHCSDGSSSTMVDSTSILEFRSDFQSQNLANRLLQPICDPKARRVAYKFQFEGVTDASVTVHVA